VWSLYKSLRNTKFKVETKGSMTLFISEGLVHLDLICVRLIPKVLFIWGYSGRHPVLGIAAGGVDHSVVDYVVEGRVNVQHREKVFLPSCRDALVRRTWHKSHDKNTRRDEK